MVLAGISKLSATNEGCRNRFGEWKTAWNVARSTAKLKYRWHDARHTFISRLAENPNVSEQTITSLAGHVSKRMLERYSHIRAQAKREAIEPSNRRVLPALRHRNGQSRLRPRRP